MSDIAIRLLGPEDAAACVVLRREMLADSPWAFAASPEDDRGLDAAELAKSLAQTGFIIVGAFDSGAAGARLIGTAGANLPRHAKMAHRAHIWGVYITPSARGKGAGTLLMRTVLEHIRAWPGVNSAGLSASVNSPGAIRLYERVGFRIWGIEPAALITGGRAYDEVHMVCLLDGRVAGNALQ